MIIRNKSLMILLFKMLWKIMSEAGQIMLMIVRLLLHRKK